MKTKLKSGIALLTLLTTLASPMGARAETLKDVGQELMSTALICIAIGGGQWVYILGAGAVSYTTGDWFDGTSDKAMKKLGKISSNEQKALLRTASEDAVAYLASDGEQKSALLSSLFSNMREVLKDNPNLNESQLSDEDLAQMIVRTGS